MSSASPSKIADRVRKLLALAHDARGNANEVSAAAAEAARLMSEHKLSESDVSASMDDGSDLVDIPAGSDGFKASWKFSLVTATARAFFCEAIGLKVKKRRKVRIVGRRQDVEVALAVFDFLLKEIQRLTDSHALEERDVVSEMLDGEMTPRERIAFYRAGLAAGVSSTLKDQAKNMKAASEKAMVLARKSKEEIREFMVGKFGQSKKVAPDDGAASSTTDFDRGFERGRSINIGATMNPKEEMKEESGQVTKGEADPNQNSVDKKQGIN